MRTKIENFKKSGQFVIMDVSMFDEKKYFSIDSTGYSVFTTFDNAKMIRKIEDAIEMHRIFCLSNDNMKIMQIKEILLEEVDIVQETDKKYQEELRKLNEKYGRV